MDITMSMSIGRVKQIIGEVLINKINNIEVGDTIVYEEDSYGNAEEYLIVSSLEGIRLLDTEENVLLTCVYDSLDRLKIELLEDNFVDNIIKRTE